MRLELRSPAHERHLPASDEDRAVEHQPPPWRTTSSPGNRAIIFERSAHVSADIGAGLDAAVGGWLGFADTGTDVAILDLLCGRGRQANDGEVSGWRVPYVPTDHAWTRDVHDGGQRRAAHVGARPRLRVL